MRIGNPGSPFPHGLGNGVFEGGCACCYRYDIRPKQFHAIDIQCLPLRILFPHKNNTLHAKQRRCSSRRNSMLTGTGFCNQSGFAHLSGKQCLPKNIIDFMCTGMIQIFAL